MLVYEALAMADSAPRKGFDVDAAHEPRGAAGLEQTAPSGQVRAGSVLRGKYRLEELLGEGGMGSVWRAHHLQLDLPVALKLLRGEHDKEMLTERMKLEARAAARLVHPAIVRVFDIDESERGEPFIVMELLDGENLAELLDRGRLSGVSAAQMLLPIVEALVLAHAKGIVHRDIKPHNVFLARDGERLQPKLLDFGIAKLTTTTRARSLTDTGAAVGSPDYMSPEQARGQSDVDARADIWQLCVVLYEAVGGRTPFDGDNYNALMRAIVEDDPAPLWLGDDIDAQLTNLIFWGLAKNREERPGTAEELGHALARWLLDRGILEDVCSTPLTSKWITRSALRSVPVVQVDPAEAARRTSSAPAPAEGTLLSARDASLSGKAVPSLALSRGSSSLGPWLAGAACLLAALAWGAWRLAAPHTASTPAAALSPPRSPPPLPSATAESPAAPSATLATTPPTPSSEAPTPTSAPLHSAPTVPTSRNAGRPRVEKPAAAAASVSKPPRVVHDDTRELLQAY